MRIRAITLHQPWATLMAIGAKHIETRTWAPRELRRGDLLAIHAGKTTQAISGIICKTTDDRSLIYDTLATAGFEQLAHVARHMHPRLGYEDACISNVRWDLPLGSVVAVVRFLYAVSTRHGVPGGRTFVSGDWVHALTEQERAFGDYSPERYGWLTELVLRLPEPVPARGAQGLWLWDVPPAIERMLADQEGR